MHPHSIRITSAAAIFLAASLAGCKKSDDDSDSDEPDATPALATPTSSTASPTPPLSSFAPPGVFFLLTGVSVKTPDGVVGLKPGTRLQKVAPGRYMAQGNQVDLRTDQVSNDLRVVQRVVGADEAAQAAIRQSQQAAQTAAAAHAAAARPATTPARRPASSTASGAIINNTRSKDGWIWEMDANGDWQPIRPEK